MCSITSTLQIFIELNPCVPLGTQLLNNPYRTIKSLGLFSSQKKTATYGSWLFMRDHQYNLFILNILTHERINLPLVESLIGTVKIRRNINAVFSIQCPVLWIDENTKDYIVLCTFQTKCVVYYKKGDQFWNHIPEISYSIHMVYKDHKLYIFSKTNILRILDFSGEVPQQIYECTMLVSKPFCRYLLDHQIHETRLVVTLRGDVLRVNRVLEYIHMPKIWSFYVYKIYSSSGVLMTKPEQIDTLGDEAIVLDLGITVFANDSGGFRRNSIYFVPHVNKKKCRTNMCDAFLFDIQTKKMEKLDKFDYLSGRLSMARWFLPNFKQT